MNLTIDNLTLTREKTYFALIAVFSLGVWIILAVTCVGIIIAAALGLGMWLANGLLVGRLKADAVLVSERQLPQLYRSFREVCQRLQLPDPPELYVIQSGGMLNSFVTRHCGRHFLVLYSDMLEAYGSESDEVRFALGHEIGHVKSKHILKQILTFPGCALPLLGPAYSRAREASCDRYGAFVTDQIDGAARAVMILAGGRKAGKVMDPAEFSTQYANHRGFFVSWYELVSGYPTLSQRVGNLLALRGGMTMPRSPRNVLAYLFALTTPSGSGGAAGPLVTVAVVALLIAILLPALAQARGAARSAVDKSNLKQMADAVHQYADDWNGSLPGSENWPELLCGYVPDPPVGKGDGVAGSVARFAGQEFRPSDGRSPDFGFEEEDGPAVVG